MAASVTPDRGFVRRQCRPRVRAAQLDIWLMRGSWPRSRLRSADTWSHAGSIGAVIEGLALGPLRDGVLALARAIRFGLFERASLARVHCTALSHFIRSSRLVSELWRTRTRCEDHCQDRCRHHPAEEG